MKKHCFVGYEFRSISGSSPLFFGRFWIIVHKTQESRETLILMTVSRFLLFWGVPTWCFDSVSLLARAERVAEISYDFDRIFKTKRVFSGVLLSISFSIDFRPILPPKMAPKPIKIRLKGKRKLDEES